MSDANITKVALANAFKEVMKTKSFNKVAVSDITNFCKLNRQTFYYHFEDKYDLLNWIYYEEIFSPLANNLSLSNFKIQFTNMYSQIKKEKTFFYNVFSIDAEYGFKDYLFIITKELVKIIINQKAMVENEFLAEFYAYGIIAMTTDWVKKGMRVEPDVLASNIEKIFLGIK